MKRINNKPEKYLQKIRLTILGIPSNQKKISTHRTYWKPIRCTYCTYWNRTYWKPIRCIKVFLRFVEIPKLFRFFFFKKKKGSGDIW